MNGLCAFAVQFIVIRMKIETAQPAVQCCADVHFFFVIRTGVSTLMTLQRASLVCCSRTGFII